MSTSGSSNRLKMTDNEIKQFIREHRDRAVTASEIAEEFGVTTQAVNYRLNKLREQGEVVKKKVGSAAAVWWVKQRQES